jgi:2'-5' RNA ligase
MLKRLFVGIAIPGDLRAKVDALSRELQTRADAALPRLRASWVLAENFHVTLQFLGSTEKEFEIAHALTGLKRKTFEVGLGGLGAFPSAKKARVLWLGAGRHGHAGHAELAALADEVAALLRPLGFEREAHTVFTGHLTLARVKIPTVVSTLMDSPAEIGSFSVKEVLLFESKTTPNRAIYRELHRISLA